MGFPVKSRAAADFDVTATIGRIDPVKPENPDIVKNKIRTLAALKEKS
jgi:hypothetical protein